MISSSSSSSSLNRLSDKPTPAHNQVASISANFNLESSLCFPKEIFYGSSFDVDAFLAHYKREYSLERLKDDLNVFLKVLELSMSELINKDYPDFVNLSTNLVDLDKAINDLKAPLETIKNDVDNVKNSIDQEIETIMGKLNEKLMIEKRRIVLKLLMNWQRSLKVTNEMIGNNNSDSSQKITGDHVERIAFEFCQLKNSLSICSGDSQDNLAQNNDINKLSQMLEKIMQDLFLNCLITTESQASPDSNITMDAETKQQLRHVLKSYSLLSKQRLAEQLFTDYKVKPFMIQYLNESYLETNVMKLNGVFEKILEFINQNAEFLKITSEIKNNNSNTDSGNQESEKNRQNNNEFDFLINSIWSNVVGCLDLSLNSIFSPSDPDLFHENFTKSFEFLNKFELKCSQFDREFKKRLLNSQSYKYFVKKWQIQVYYQIRFQEIVSKFEEDLLSYDVKFSSDYNEVEDFEAMDMNSNMFYLVTSETLVKQMEYCWHESKCFLKCLLSQFWKLNLQLVSRYCAYFRDIYQKDSSEAEQTEPAQSSLAPDQPAQPRSKTPTDMSSLASDLATQSSIVSNKSLANALNLSVLLLNDVNKLSTLKLPNFFDGVIAPVMRSCNAMKDISVLKEAFGCSLNELNELQSVIIESIVKNQVEKCLTHLKNANDIPRLYRRTNREIPKTASIYVGLTVDVIIEFKQTFANSKNSTRQQELIVKCVNSIIDSICLKFHSLANDLLESVKKMEDSLKRLQKVRQTKSSANLSGSSSGSASMSDDDKIRLQLKIDISEFGNQLAEKCDGYKGGSNYDELLKIVDEINKHFMDNSKEANSFKNKLNSDANNSNFVVSEENETNII